MQQNNQFYNNQESPTSRLVQIIEPKGNNDISANEILNYLNNNNIDLAVDIDNFIKKYGLLGNYQYIDTNTKNGKFVEYLITEKYFTSHKINQFLVYNANKDNIQYTCQRTLNGAVFQMVNNKWIQVCYPMTVAEDINTKGVKNWDNLKIDLLNRYKDNGAFALDKLYDGSIINAYFSKIHDYWVMSSKKCTNIMQQPWRGIQWSECSGFFASFVERIKDNVDVTYVLNISYNKIHHMTKKSNIRIIATVSKEFTNYHTPRELPNSSKKNLSETLDYVIEELKKSDPKKFDENCRNIVGFAIRFKDRSVLIKSNVYSHIARLIYKDFHTFDKEIFRSIEYPIANSYVYGIKYCDKYFPCFSEYYKKIAFTEQSFCRGYSAAYMLGEKKVLEMIKKEDPKTEVGALNILGYKLAIEFYRGKIPSTSKKNTTFVFKSQSSDEKTNQRQCIIDFMVYNAENRNFMVIYNIVKFLKPSLKAIFKGDVVVKKPNNNN